MIPSFTSFSRKACSSRVLNTLFSQFHHPFTTSPLSSPAFRGRWSETFNSANSSPASPSPPPSPPSSLVSSFYRFLTSSYSNEIHLTGREMFLKLARHAGWNPAFYQWAGLERDYFNGTVPLHVLHVVLLHIRLEPLGSYLSRLRLGQYNRELFWYLWSDMEWEVENAAGSLRADKAMGDIQRRVAHMIDQLKEIFHEQTSQTNELKIIAENSKFFRGPKSLSACIWRFVYGASDQSGTKRHVRLLTLYVLATWVQLQKIPIEQLRRNEFDWIKPTEINEIFLDLERKGVVGDPKDENVQEWSRFNEEQENKQKP
jgi:hypothetical protein